MSNTYRLRLVWTRDNAHSSSVRKFTKRFNRRDERRKQRVITATAIREFYSEQKFDVLETIDIDYSYADDFNEYDLALEREDELARRYNYYDDFAYDPYYDYEYADDWYSSHREINEETPHDRIIKPEDAGKTLGEILEEIQQRKQKA